jgi:hypothetical protein
MVSRVMSAAVGAVLVVSACGVRMSQPAAGNPNVTRQDFTVFAPFSYRSELPRVSFYPRLAMPGKEVIVMARPIQGFSGETCLRIIDADAGRSGPGRISAIWRTPMGTLGARLRRTKPSCACSAAMMGVAHDDALDC